MVTLVLLLILTIIIAAQGRSESRPTYRSRREEMIDRANNPYDRGDPLANSFRETLKHKP